MKKNGWFRAQPRLSSHKRPQQHIVVIFPVPSPLLHPLFISDCPVLPPRDPLLLSVSFLWTCPIFLLSELLIQKSQIGGLIPNTLTSKCYVNSSARPSLETVLVCTRLTSSHPPPPLCQDVAVILWDRCLHCPPRLVVTFSLSSYTCLTVLFLRSCSSSPVSFLLLVSLRVYSLFISDIPFPFPRVS